VLDERDPDLLVETAQLADEGLARGSAAEHDHVPRHQMFGREVWCRRARS
jgi:hypothetical protein